MPTRVARVAMMRVARRKTRSAPSSPVLESTHLHFYAGDSGASRMCGLGGCSAWRAAIVLVVAPGEHLSSILRRHPPHPVIASELLSPDPVVLDLTGANPSLSCIDLSNALAFQAYIDEQLAKTGARVAVGRYDEDRIVYRHSSLFGGDEARSVHLGIDLFVPPGTPLMAPHEAAVHSMAGQRRHRRLRSHDSARARTRGGSVSYPIRTPEPCVARTIRAWRALRTWTALRDGWLTRGKRWMASTRPRTGDRAGRKGKGGTIRGWRRPLSGSACLLSVQMLRSSAGDLRKTRYSSPSRHA